MSGIWQEPFESDNAFSTLGAELGVSFLVVNKSPILLFQHSYRDKGRSLYKYLTVINILYCTFVLLHEIIIDRITQMIIFYCYWKYYFFARLRSIYSLYPFVVGKITWELQWLGRDAIFDVQLTLVAR